MALGLEKGEFRCVDIHFQTNLKQGYIHIKCTKKLFTFLRYVETVVTLSHLCIGLGLA